MLFVFQFYSMRKYIQIKRSWTLYPDFAHYFKWRQAYTHKESRINGLFKTSGVGGWYIAILQSTQLNSTDYVPMADRQECMCVFVYLCVHRGILKFKEHEINILLGRELSMLSYLPVGSSVTRVNSLSIHHGRLYPAVSQAVAKTSSSRQVQPREMDGWGQKLRDRCCR